MIYDCFLFNNELEILDIRLHELDSIVDKFVITESTVTHMNKPKPLYFKENEDKFYKFKSKIIHNVISDSPDVNNPWIINDFQFSQQVRGLKKANPNDIVMFGDVDEIPKVGRVKEWSRKKGNHKQFKQWLAYYYLNYLLTKPYSWSGTHMMKYSELKKLDTMWIAKYSPIDTFIPQGGWHLSYMGGVKRIQQKISSQAHQEYNTNKYNTPENILKGILQGKDFMGQGNKFKIASMKLLPKYVQDNPEIFKESILKSMPMTKNLSALLVPLGRLRILLRNSRAKYKWK